MVDEERVTRLAAEVLDDVGRLRALAVGAGLRADIDRLDAVKYRFITAIEGCLSIAHHVVASEGWSAPDTNADAMRELAAHGVVAVDLANTMAKASGFRNLLVHQYGDIDDDAVVEFIDRLGDLEQFVTAVLAWNGRTNR